ncbi:MAG TPA: nucleoside hydrolase [Flavisolibacter sp.]|nr:nucleoside hydrolase [Flavisolibacter sp.]
MCLAFFIAFGQASKVKEIIFDTDMGPDYDDVGAMAMLHAYADSGYIRILATVASTKYKGVAGVLNVFNTYFRRPDIPIGIAKDNGPDLKDFQHWTDTLLANYPHIITDNEQVPDAVDVYRKVLSRQPDNTVIIITVGFFTNLSNLLKSGGDQYSPLTGLQLIRKKVKLLVSMAGRFPSGKEFNIEKDANSSQYVFEHWQTPVIFSGFEIGQQIKTGLPLIHMQEIKNSPVKDVFRICIPMGKNDSAGRMSWDETAVLVAVKGYAPFYTLHKGKILIASDGSNAWDENGKHQSYLAEHMQPEAVQEIINAAIMHSNKKK